MPKPLRRSGRNSHAWSTRLRTVATTSKAAVPAASTRCSRRPRALDDPATHPLVLDVLERVLGPAQLSAPTAIAIGPGERAQPLHPDDAIYPVPPARGVWSERHVAASTTSPSRTARPRIVPGSHRWIDEVPRPDADDRSSVRDARGLGDALRRQLVARRRREPHADVPRVGVVLHYAAVVAAAGGEPRARGAAAKSCARCPNGYRNCSGTTSTRRSSATSTAVIRDGSCSSYRNPDASRRAWRACRHAFPSASCRASCCSTSWVTCQP